MEGQRWLRLVAYNLVAIALGVLAGLVIVAFAGGNIGLALTSLFLGPISTSYNIAEVLVRFIALYTIGLGIGLALKAGLWNVGGEGQFLIGEIMAFVGALYIQGVPGPVQVVLMLLIGSIGGALWIAIPTILRTKFGANEIVITLLFNIVAVFVGLYALNGPIRGKSQSFGYPITDQLSKQLSLPLLIPNTRLSLALVITLVIAAAMYLLVERTPFSVKARTVGESIETANYAGINVTRVFVTVMLAAGALAGLAGAMHLMGVLGRLDTGELQPGFGYLAIIVAMLGRKNMLGIGVASIFLGYVMVGAEDMAQFTQVQTPVVYAMEGVMLLGVSLANYLLTRSRGVS